jgi:hypothetical protein
VEGQIRGSRWEVLEMSPAKVVAPKPNRCFVDFYGLDSLGPLPLADYSHGNRGRSFVQFSRAQQRRSGIVQSSTAARRPTRRLRNSLI